MANQDPTLVQLLTLPVVELVCLLVVVWRGYLKPSSLARCPLRWVNLTVRDAVIANAPILLMLLLMVIGASLSALGYLRPLTADQAEPLSALHKMLMALASQAVIHLPPCIYLVYRVSRWPGGVRELGILSGDLVSDVKIGFKALLAAIPMVFGITNLVSTLAVWLMGEQTPQIGHELLRVIQASDSYWATFGLFVSAAVVAPILEEGIFRGLMQTVILNVLGRSQRWAVVVVSALIFSLVHVGQPWQVLPGLFVLGVVLGWLYERTGSLLPSIIVHAGFNAFNIGLVLMLMAPGE